MKNIFKLISILKKISAELLSQIENNNNKKNIQSLIASYDDSVGTHILICLLLITKQPLFTSISLKLPNEGDIHRLCKNIAMFAIQMYKDKQILFTSIFRILNVYFQQDDVNSIINSISDKTKKEKILQAVKQYNDVENFRIDSSFFPAVITMIADVFDYATLKNFLETLKEKLPNDLKQITSLAMPMLAYSGFPEDQQCKLIDLLCEAGGDINYSCKDKLCKDKSNLVYNISLVQMVVNQGCLQVFEFLLNKNADLFHLSGGKREFSLLRHLEVAINYKNLSEQQVMMFLSLMPEKIFSSDKQTIEVLLHQIINKQFILPVKFLLEKCDVSIFKKVNFAELALTFLDGEKKIKANLMEVICYLFPAEKIDEKLLQFFVDKEIIKRSDSNPLVYENAELLMIIMAYKKNDTLEKLIRLGFDPGAKSDRITLRNDHRPTVFYPVIMNNEAELLKILLHTPNEVSYENRIENLCKELCYILALTGKIDGETLLFKHLPKLLTLFSPKQLEELSQVFRKNKVLTYQLTEEMVRRKEYEFLKLFLRSIKFHFREGINRECFKNSMKDSSINSKPLVLDHPLLKNIGIQFSDSMHPVSAAVRANDLEALKILIDHHVLDSFNLSNLLLLGEMVYKNSKNDEMLNLLISMVPTCTDSHLLAAILNNLPLTIQEKIIDKMNNKTVAEKVVNEKTVVNAKTVGNKEKDTSQNIDHALITSLLIENNSLLKKALTKINMEALSDKDLKWVIKCGLLLKIMNCDANWVELYNTFLFCFSDNMKLIVNKFILDQLIQLNRNTYSSTAETNTEKVCKEIEIRRDEKNSGFEMIISEQGKLNFSQLLWMVLGTIPLSEVNKDVIEDLQEIFVNNLQTMIEYNKLKKVKELIQSSLFDELKLYPAILLIHFVKDGFLSGVKFLLDDGLVDIFSQDSLRNEVFNIALKYNLIAILEVMVSYINSKQSLINESEHLQINIQTLFIKLYTAIESTELKKLLSQQIPVEKLSFLENKNGIVSSENTNKNEAEIKQTAIKDDGRFEYYPLFVNQKEVLIKIRKKDIDKDQVQEKWQKSLKNNHQTKDCANSSDLKKVGPNVIKWRPDGNLSDKRMFIFSSEENNKNEKAKTGDNKKEEVQIFETRFKDKGHRKRM